MSAQNPERWTRRKNKLELLFKTQAPGSICMETEPKLAARLSFSTRQDEAPGNTLQAATAMASKWDESDYVFLSKGSKLQTNGS